MRRDRGRSCDAHDRGAATVEVLALTLVMIVPLVHLVLGIGRAQAAAYAAEAASYAAARAAVVAGLDALQAGEGDPAARAAARQHAEASVALAVEGFGFSADDATLTLECAADCLAPGTTVDAHVSVRATLPGIPEVIQAAVPARVTLSADASAPVDGLAP